MSSFIFHVLIRVAEQSIVLFPTDITVRALTSTVVQEAKEASQGYKDSKPVDELRAILGSLKNPIPPKLPSLASTSSHQALSNSSQDDEWSDEFLQELDRLGEGAGGAVHKVRDKRTDVVMARKTIVIREAPVRQLKRELTFLSSTSHLNIVKFYAAYISPSSMEIKLLMEFCEGGCLEAIGKQIREKGWRIGERVAGRLVEGVSYGFCLAHTFPSRSSVDRRITHCCLSRPRYYKDWRICTLKRLFTGI